MAKNRVSPSQAAGYAHQTDTILVVENVEILVNRQMLSVLSPYLERLLMGNFKETNETRIELKEVKLDTFSDCWDILCGKELVYRPAQMSLERLSNLLVMADRFDINAVRLFCQWEMNFHSVGQEVDRYLLACQHNLPDQSKARLLSFVSTEKLIAWSKGALSALSSRTKRSVDNSDLARAFAVCAGRADLAGFPAANPLVVSDFSVHDNLADQVVELGDEQYPVNKSMMCFLSPHFNKLFKEGEGEISVHIPESEAKSDIFRDSMNIVHGRPISDYSPGTMCSTRLFHLLDLSFRFSLSPVRVFCSMELALLSEGKEFERYLLACHFNISHCKDLLLPLLSTTTFFNLDVPSLASVLPINYLELDVDDIRTILSISADCALTQKTVTDVAELPNPSDYFKESGITDAVLVVGNCEFHVNKGMMSFVSPYFHRLLMIEGINESRFVLEGVDPCLFGLCLHISYGVMPETYKRGELSSSYMVGLLKYAHRFKLAPVKLFCDHEMFKYEGHEMDRFLVSAACYPEETESLLSHLTNMKVVAWLERDVRNGFSHCPRNPVRLTANQLGRLLELSYGNPLVHESGLHIRPSSLSVSALNDRSKPVQMTIYNKGTTFLVVDSRNGDCIVDTPLVKLAPEATCRLRLESKNGRYLSVGSNWSLYACSYSRQYFDMNDATRLRQNYSCTRSFPVSIPFVK